ncbi:MAG: transglycosylase SLT domain-containing protein [Yoonia sp.]|nr:transglycosylase SLT domain-containing protein [Yoonia sp.]
MMALMIAGTAMANPEIRPFSRDDATAARMAQAQVALAAYSPTVRPAHMIRYPVAANMTEPTMRPVARNSYLPNTRWGFKDGSELWTRAAMVAVGAHGNGLDSIVPRDIDTWCPAYAQNSPTLRRAFWVGMMSALSKHESTYNPRAVGGGGLWYGLLQIYPDTARRYGCRARTGEALKNPADNLSCAARIMAVTVARDRAVALRDSRWRGVAADWGPMTKPSKIAEMAAWTREQTYCTAMDSMRPVARPVGATWAATISSMTFTD